MTILICGEALYDVFFEAERAEGFTLDARIGGSAFNVAIGLGRLGQSVGLLTGVSQDRLGEKLAQTLAGEGVDTTYLRRKDATTTLGMVSLDDKGSAQYRFYGEGAADRLVGEADLPDVEPLSAASFGCFSLLTKPTGDTFLAFAERVAAAGRLVALDPNIRPSVEPDFAVWRARVDAFAEQARFGPQIVVAVAPCHAAIQHFLGPKAPAQAQMIEPWAKKIEEESNGRYNVTIYGGEQLGTPRELFTQLALGITQISASGDPGIKDIEYLAIPFLMLITAPIALVMAMVSVYNTFNGDSELVVMSAAGNSQKTRMPPGVANPGGSNARYLTRRKDDQCAIIV